MKMRLLTTLVAATALGGCASYYDTAAGSAPGGYYVGRAPAAAYGPFDSGYGYGGMSLGYGFGYGGFGYGGYGFSRPYYGYGGYYPYHPYRPYPPRPPRPDTETPRPPGEGNRPPPWRRPDGRYQESGSVMIPPRRQQAVPQDASAAAGYPDRPQVTPPPRPMAPPSAPRVERPRPVERVERPQPRVRERTEEP